MLPGTGARRRSVSVFTGRDNGVGAERYIPHQGLRGIAERVEELNGEMSIETAPGEGFFTRISLPLLTDPEDRR